MMNNCLRLWRNSLPNSQITNRFFRLMKHVISILMIAAISSGFVLKPKKQKKSAFPFGTWMRSQEEDKDPNASWLLYRPDSYSFPPARGRSGVTVLKDGRFALLGPSAVDGLDTSWGTWKREATNRLAVSVSGSAFKQLNWKTVKPGILLIELK